ncbi:MAG: 1-acyl-sn-glycerol-3-phosphate acyltransferase [Lachnospiraceae bacterium]|nr:1-acyl-sn-glycerol-3-phosphate acyltransferase [Lachnospiraceae bacterium]
MWRYYYLIGINLFGFAGMIQKMRKMAADDTCSEKERYEYLRYTVRVMQKKGYTCTEVFGAENLPDEGGYVMYPNHQGKYDAYGIVGVHEKPCTVVMDKAKSYDLFIKQVIDMIKGKRLDKEDVRQAFGVMNEIAEEVARGRRYIIFPEGEYDKEKKNTLRDFKAGCFKTSLKSKTPIVPVTLIDSYKAWNSSIIGTVTTQVHFLKPIFYDEYKGMKTGEIAAMVRARIQEKLNEILKTEVVVQ